MCRKILVMAVAIALSAAFIGGCKKSSQEPQTPPAEANESAEQQVKTLEEYKAEAEQEITKENMQDELAKIEKEVDEDLATEQ